MTIIEKIIHWGNNQPQVRVLLLTGSRAGKRKQDEFSDYDIAVYGSDFTFIKDDEWLKNIGDHLICIHEKFEFNHYHIPTRLTIFEQGYKIDFSFHPMTLLRKIVSKEKLPDEYNIGYQILLDKESITSKMKVAGYKGFIISKPTEKDFQNNANEFWFEVYHVAKYLNRDDLWAAKFRDWSAKQWLRQMLEWHYSSKHQWDVSIKNDGKYMRDWLDAKLWSALFLCFGSFSKADSLQALHHTTQLYRQVAKEIAVSSGYAYNQKLDDSISRFIEKL